MPRKAPTIVEERRITGGDYERKMQKKVVRSETFKNYCEGVQSITFPMAIAGVGFGVYKGCQWIAAGIGDIDLLGVSTWWDRRLQSAAAQVNRGRDISDNTGLPPMDWLNWITGLTTGSDEKNDDGSLKKWWQV